jgi:hypothetical protein
MGAQRTSFAKLQRDRAKKAKAAQKRERRQGGGEFEGARTVEDQPTVVDDGGELSAPVLLQLIEDIHKAYDAKEISFEEFEEKKIELLGRLPID